MSELTVNATTNDVVHKDTSLSETKEENVSNNTSIWDEDNSEIKRLFKNIGYGAYFGATPGLMMAGLASLERLNFTPKVEDEILKLEKKIKSSKKNLEPLYDELAFNKKKLSRIKNLFKKPIRRGGLYALMGSLIGAGIGYLIYTQQNK